MTGPVDDLARIEDIGPLDRTHTYLFVAGPGVGEAIAVALPERGWITVDCCRVNGSLPLVDLFERLRAGEDDLVELAVVSHPHTDHVEGLPDLLSRTKPRHVGVAGVADPRKDLYAELEALIPPVEAAPLPTEERLVRRSVAAAFAAIRHWSETTGGPVLGLADAWAMALGATQLCCRAPDAALLRAFLDVAPQKLARRVRQRANEISTVLEIGDPPANIVLGGDLPTTTSTKAARPIATGWNTVTDAHPHLGGHCALKLPHHGSEAAWHPALMSAPTRSRRWVCTPYDRSGLPTAESLRRLVQDEAVHLTRTPTALIANNSRRRLPIGALQSSRPATGDPLLDRGRPSRSKPIDSPQDVVWAFEFDCSGAPLRRWAGSAAVVVVP